MTYELKLDLPLSDDHLKAIGRVTANWTMIEHTLERYIWFQVSMGHEVGKCLTTHMSYPQRLQAVLTLCHDMFHAERALRKFADKMTNGPYTKWNDIVHATWESDDETGAATIAKRTARVELKEMPLPYTVEQIEYVAREIEAAFCELNPRRASRSMDSQSGAGSGTRKSAESIFVITQMLLSKIWRTGCPYTDQFLCFISSSY